MKTTNEDILIQGCLANKRKYQKQLYNNYKDAMFTICLRITGNENDALDSLQEGFISVFNSLKSFQGKSSLGAWIKTIMVRKSLKKLNNIHFIEIENIPNQIIFETEISGNDLHEAILKLDKGYRTVFVLYEIEGYSHREISEMLKISEGTSKSQLHHAKAKLKQILKQYYNYER
jgi:RNA polymerase sigma factor (sigma-70 family)